MFAAKPTIPYPPAGGRWNIGFALLLFFRGSCQYVNSNPALVSLALAPVSLSPAAVTLSGSDVYRNEMSATG